jgi:hypothetical protein
MGKGCTIIHENCDPDLAQDRSLPNNAFIVEYKLDGATCYDIASGQGQVDIFDVYWDKYHRDFVTMKQTEGRTNPKMWGVTPKKKKGKGP